MYYLIAITGFLCLAYVVLFFLFPYFFKSPRASVGINSLVSMFWVVLFSLAIYAIDSWIPDPWLANRFLHAMGGGFAAFLVCFFVVRDRKMALGKVQFVVFSILIVIALGVANEILEFVLQNTTKMVFADSINDTWLDLISNTVGALLAALCLTSWIRHRK